MCLCKVKKYFLIIDFRGQMKLLYISLCHWVSGRQTYQYIYVCVCVNAYNVKQLACKKVAESLELRK